MTNEPSALVERRRFPRIAPKGSVIFHAGRHEQRGRIANLSEGGAFIATTTRAPARVLGRRLEMQVRFDSGHARWLPASGQIVRIDAGGIGVAFEALASPLLRVVDELALASHSRARNMSILLIDADERRRSAMASGFRAIGCTVVESNTPLEAIVRLGESSFEPDAIVLPRSASTGDDAAMLAFVEQNHPTAKVITLTDDLLKPDGFASWLASSHADGALLPRKRMG